MFHFALVPATCLVPDTRVYSYELLKGSQILGGSLAREPSKSLNPVAVAVSDGSAGESAALVIERGWSWPREGKVCRAEPPQRLELRLQNVCGLIEEPV